MARRAYIDWARGLAVLIMMQWHGVDAWVRPADRASRGFGYLGIIGGAAAPLFLWLAGLAVVMALEKTASRGTTRWAAAMTGVRRGFQIFGLAFVFRAQSFVLSPFKPIVSLLRVDILNVLGLGIAAAAAVWALGRHAVGAVVLGAVVATAIAFSTPVIRTAAWLPALPSVVQWYLTQHPLSKFTLLPWAGFVFAGVVCGTWIWHGARSSTSVGPDSPAPVVDDGRVMGLMAIGGAALTGVSWWASFQPSIYSPPASFWSTSPTYFGLRVGLMMMTLAALWVCVPLARRVPVPFAVLERLGRDSLFIYWIHVELVYGYLTWPLHRRLPVWGALMAWILLSFAMFRALDVRDRWLARWLARWHEHQST